ncbi:MAG: hypothetical protein AAF647_02090 [Pseudomonadota bacterium]
MTSFKERYDEIISDIIGASGHKFKAHLLLTKFSQTPQNFEDSAYRELARLSEAASMAVMLRSAGDLVKPERKMLLSRRDDDLALPEAILAGVSMNRHDIFAEPSTPTSPGEGRGQRDRFPLKLENHDTEGPPLSTSIHNPDANSGFEYDFKRWMDERLEILRTCVNAGAQIITLGEFDYPPVFNDAHDREFNKEVQSLIDGAQQEVFLLAGSRHEVDRANRKVIAAWNRAKIFANTKLACHPRAEDSPFMFPVDHEKIVPAEKAGERITIPRKPTIGYYETRLGRIGVLVCVDAYSPNVLFTLLNQRQLGAEEKLDYILIPAYNMSPKFYFACQVVSLACQTVVVLADSCSVSPRKKERVALFVGGRLFSDSSSDVTPLGRESIGEIRSGEGSQDHRVWRLNRKFLIDQQQKAQSANDPMSEDFGEITSFFSQSEFFADTLMDI